MLSFPNCKINLGLYITSRRPDHFHDLLTCFVPVPWTDVLEIVPTSTFEFLQTGLQVPGDAMDNLCVKAYQLLKDAHNLPPVRIHLHKILPMGAGLGGGSSDAAFVLTGLNDLFVLGLTPETLESAAARLGSDCAFFVRNKPVIATGRGEVMENLSVDLKGAYLLILHPSVHVSTADAFRGVQPKPFEGDLKRILADKKTWKTALHNQFEDTIFPKYPLLADLKAQLYDQGAWYAAMSGSGSSVFGLFDQEPQQNGFDVPSYCVKL